MTDIPPLTLGWRLQMAMAWGNVTRSDLARDLGYDESTISRWCSGKGAPPRPPIIREWARLCRCNPVWLEHGEAGGGTPPTPGGGLTKPPGDKLAALTAEKRRRSRRGVATEQYPLPSAA